MMLRSQLLIAAATVALAGSPALADSHGSKGKGMHGGHHFGRHMDKMDTDKDGTVTRDEARAARKTHLMEADANGDGAVSLEELQAHREKMAEMRRKRRVERRFKRLDANGDGKITSDEIDKMKMPMFDRVDANGDGKITKEEREAHRAEMKEHHGRMHKRHMGGDDEKDGQ